MDALLTKYAQLLVQYCLDIQEGDRLFIRTSTLAEPLLREVYREAIRAGARTIEYDMSFQGRGRSLIQEAADWQLDQVSPFYELAMREFETYLYIRAPFNLRESQNNDPEKAKRLQAAHRPITQTYFERTGSGAMRRSLCQFPTNAAAQEAGMALEEYQDFVFKACHLYADDPKSEWLRVREQQQKIVDLLNARQTVRYVGDGIDLTFSTKGRTWINSDGRTNMPSGEVYTSPVEDSVNGVVHFSYPAIYMGHEVEGVTLWAKDGYIERWEAKRGQAFLDRIFAMEGTRRFGEAAIGTNYHIDRFTKNILFDEKIGGTIHLAIGQSYLQAGGRNQSSVHWDMIADMKSNGEIYADGEKIYEAGNFVFM